MRKFVSYQIIYTYIFYLENLVHVKAAFEWNQYKSILKIIIIGTVAAVGPTCQPLSPLLCTTAHPIASHDITAAASC
jgi:hypothetical protein